MDSQTSTHSSSLTPEGHTGSAASTPASSNPPSRGSSSSKSSRPKVYGCDYEGCGKMYSRPSLLTQHQRSHTDSRPFSCSVCQAGFLRDDHLRRHMISHSDDKPFKCSYCGKGLTTRQQLRRHEVVHTKSFKCEFEGCDESFYKHQSLRHHVNSVHLKTLTCKDCGKTFQRPLRLENHRAKHHGEGPAYHCDYSRCFRTFKVWSALQLHMKTEHTKLKCSICNKGCIGEEGLKMHMVIHDEEKSIKLWKCNECPKDFLKKESLLLHCQNDHEFIPNSLQQVITENDAKVLNTSRVETMVNKGQTAMDLLLDTVSPKQLIPCTYKRCHREFKKEYDLRRHLAWHEKQKIIIAKKLEEIQARKQEEAMVDQLFSAKPQTDQSVKSEETIQSTIPADIEVIEID